MKGIWLRKRYRWTAHFDVLKLLPAAAFGDVSQQVGKGGDRNGGDGVVAAGGAHKGHDGTADGVVGLADGHVDGSAVVADLLLLGLREYRR